MCNNKKISLKFIILILLTLFSQRLFATGYNYEAEVTADGSLNMYYNVFTNSSRELTTKFDSGYSADTFLEIKMPEGVYNTNIIHYLRLRLYTMQVTSNTTASVYLLNASYLDHKLNKKTIPNVIAKVGTLHLTKGKQQYVNVDLDKKTIIDFINKNHYYTRNLVLAIRVKKSKNQKIAFASTDYLPKFKPRLFINSSRDIMTNPWYQKRIIRGSILKESFLDQTGHPAYFKPDYLMVTNAGSNSASTRHPFLELELPSNALTNDVISDMSLNFYQAYASQPALIDIYLSTNTTELPTPLSRKNMPSTDQYVATLYINPKNNNGFVRARLLHNRIIHFIHSHSGKKFILKMQMRNKNGTVYLGSSYSPIPGSAPSLSINLKQPITHPRHKTNYIQLLLSSDQHRSTPIHVKKVYAVDADQHKQINLIPTEGTNMYPDSLLYFGRASSAGSPVQTGYVEFELDSPSYLDKIAIEHFSHKGNHDALTNYAILGSNDGIKWEVLGYAKRNRDNAVPGEQIQIIDLGVNAQKTPLEGIIYSTTADLGDFNFKVRHMAMHFMVYHPLSITSYGTPKDVSIWIPKMPKGVQATIRIENGKHGGHIQTYKVASGLHVVQLENEWSTLMVGFVSEKKSDFSGYIRFSAYDVDRLPTYKITDETSWEGFVHQIKNSRSRILQMIGRKLFYAFSKEEFKFKNSDWKTNNYSLKATFDTSDITIPRYIFGIAGLNGVEPWTAVSILAVVWGLMGIVWPYNFMANKQMLQEHHHHHHHNNKTPAKKIGKAKKNYKRT